jgi:hypothetical protein
MEDSSSSNSAIEHYPTLRPDIMVIAKGIANGFPLSGIVSRKELMDLQKPGSMGGTYAGNAVSCAAAVAVQEVFEEEKILDNVAARGQELFGLLNELKADKEIGNTIAEVRGLGLVRFFSLSPSLSLFMQFANPPAPRIDGRHRVQLAYRPLHSLGFGRQDPRQHGFARAEQVLGAGYAHSHHLGLPVHSVSPPSSPSPSRPGSRLTS